VSQPTAPPLGPRNETTGTLFYLNHIVRSPSLFHSLPAHKHAATAARINKRYWSDKMREMQVHELRSVTAFWDTVRLKCDGTRLRTGGEVKGKLANAVGSQYPSHYLGTWCNQHYYRWCAHLGCAVVDRTDASTPRRFKRTRPFRRKTKSCFCACAIIFQLASNTSGRVQFKCGGTLWRTGGEVKGELANRVGSSVLFTLPRNMCVSSITTADAHTSAAQ